jgi:hypothetical protein
MVFSTAIISPIGSNEVNNMASIDHKSLLRTLSTTAPTIKKIADEIVREQFFEPAVQAMQHEFDDHPVTQEIDAGIDSPNVSNTLAPSSYDHMNLFSFIGFNAGDHPTDAIRDYLDPNSPGGPKMSYLGKDSSRLEFRYKISAPDQDAIYQATPLPWAPGISWAKRIEVGMAGLGQFLNLGEGETRASSRSGGGIQVKNTIRPGVQFRATSYLSAIFNNFLRHMKGDRSFRPTH